MLGNNRLLRNTQCKILKNLAILSFDTGTNFSLCASGRKSANLCGSAELYKTKHMTQESSICRHIYAAKS